jgi:hypothetical protein
LFIWFIRLVRLSGSFIWFVRLVRSSGSFVWFVRLIRSSGSFVRSSEDNKRFLMSRLEALKTYDLGLDSKKLLREKPSWGRGDQT